MLGRTQRIIILIAVAAIVLVIAASWLFPYDQYCQQSPPANKYYCGAADFLVFAAGVLKTYSDAITAVATAVIGVFTWTIYKVNRSQLAHSREVERAYVSGGVRIDFEQPRSGSQQFPTVQDLIPSGPIPRRLMIVVDNHGKTPAFIEDIAFESCAPGEAPPTPKYERRVADFWISPETIEAGTQYGILFEEGVGKVIYGRIYYRDIFRERHSIGFICQVGRREVSPWRGESREYTDWD
jgi:hypothetical protein